MLRQHCTAYIKHTIGASCFCHRGAVPSSGSISRLSSWLEPVRIESLSIDDHVAPEIMVDGHLLQTFGSRHVAAISSHAPM